MGKAEERRRGDLSGLCGIDEIRLEDIPRPLANADSCGIFFVRLLQHKRCMMKERRSLE